MSNADELEAMADSTCPDCGKPNPHCCDQDDVYVHASERCRAEAEKGTQLQHVISDEEFCKMNKVTDKVDRARLAEIIHNYGEKDAAEKIFDIIDRQGKVIERFRADNPFHVNCMWCGYEMKRHDKKEMLAAVAHHLLDCKEHPLARRIVELADQLKALEKNLHDECASSSQTIILLQGQLKAKDDALRDIIEIRRSGYGLSTAIVKMTQVAAKALKGGD